MVSSTVGRKRTTCESCALPYYTEHGGCPYCEMADPTDDGDDADAASEDSGFVFGDDGSERLRTTCSTCGLPHYDDADGCPYCSHAGKATSQTDGEPKTGEPAEADASTGGSSASEKSRAGAQPAEQSGGLFTRLKRALGL